MGWCPRQLFISPIHYGLVVSEKALHRELRRLNVPRSRWPERSGPADATTHKLEKGDGQLAALVYIHPRRKVSRNQTAALIVHEAVHVWQWIREVIGETHPSAEFEAYAVQRITQELLEKYDKATKCSRTGPGRSARRSSTRASSSS
jgi:hypothetical protein